MQLTEMRSSQLITDDVINGTELERERKKRREIRRKKRHNIRPMRRNLLVDGKRESERESIREMSLMMFKELSPSSPLVDQSVEVTHWRHNRK